MKKILKLSLLVIVSAIFFTSCKKNADPPAFQSYLRYKLDGVQVESNAHIRATYLPATIGSDQVITISGNWSGGSISLYLNEPQILSARQYLFEPFTLRKGEIWTNGPTGRYYIAGFCLVCSSGSGSGQIIFSEISAEYVKGTFEFTTGIDAATNTFKTVTAGEFYIKRG